MDRTPSLNPLKKIQTTKDQKLFEGSKEEEDYQEQPLSPMTRLLHEPGANIYILAIIGTKTPIDPDLPKAVMVHIIQKNHRFSSLQVKQNGNITWIPTRVNIDNHIIVPEIDPRLKSFDKFVEEYISELSRSSLDSSKPLWEVHILNTKTSGTCILRTHHSLGDGLSLMNLLLSCSRKVSDHEALPTLPSNKVFSRHMRPTSLISLFIVLWNSLVAVVMFILTALFLKDTETPLKGFPGTEDRPRRYVLRSVSLDDIKMVKKAMDITVNDVVVGFIQAGLSRYLNRYGAGENIRLRAVVPINLRAATMFDAFANTTSSHEGWGNKFGYVLLPLNMRLREDPLDYVRDVKTTIGRKKASLEPIWTEFVSSMVIKLFGYKIAGKLNRKIYLSTTLCLSNVPGPQEEISAFGHEVSYLAATFYGLSTALIIQAVSYVDKVTLVVAVDEETIPDPEKLCDDLQHSFHLIKTAVLSKGYDKK
ncbi:O-acyltransferase, WSD1 domain-containing protein [Artemisia annua]|uniref:O-acyltransferase, WSD1 domain-containing protein n=1 Tax=Artemisia annua TaxID=35608 RepID=A0A2U1LSM7_ARTAN|nr:O-acyltransferase, WSD1 domain-containing protein [Artemisia annua]